MTELKNKYKRQTQQLIDQLLEAKKDLIVNTAKLDQRILEFNEFLELVPYNDQTAEMFKEVNSKLPDTLALQLEAQKALALLNREIEDLETDLEWIENDPRL